MEAIARTMELVNRVRDAVGDVEMCHVEEDRLAQHVIECVASGKYGESTLRLIAGMALEVLREERTGWYA